MTAFCSPRQIPALVSWRKNGYPSSTSPVQRVSRRSANQGSTAAFRLLRPAAGCPRGGAVLHSTYATALSCLSDVDPKDAIPPITPYLVMRVGQVPVVPYTRPGSSEVKPMIDALAASHPAVLLENHGPVVASASLDAAVFAIEELEEAAKLAIILRGMNVRHLSREAIADLNRTFKAIGGFEQPSEGTVLIDGNPMNGVPAYQRPVNMVFQHYALFPHLDVQANVSYGLRQRRPRIDRREIDRRTIEALELVRLGGFAARRIHEMSGGQQQRVALARAIVNRPSVLLLDEPLAALDRKLRTAMQIELQSLQRELGITFVLVTHDQEEALSMSDLVCVMNAGRIEQMAPLQEVYDRPATLFVADFSSCGSSAAP